MPALTVHHGCQAGGRLLLLRCHGASRQQATQILVLPTVQCYRFRWTIGAAFRLLLWGPGENYGETSHKPHAYFGLQQTF